ncbi:MAG: BglII/BstYI family type II restriction endonuclease [Thermoleophilaceae bacterium]
MDLTESYLRIFSSALTDRYEMREVREAAAVLSSTNPEEFEHIASVLDGFSLEDADFLEPGGQKGRVATRLDEAFRLLGWREGRHDTKITSLLRIMPYRAAGETQPHVVETEVANEGYKVDNVRGRVALDVEWNAKDGNLDRDLGAYRALYDAGAIAGGVILTRTTADLRALGAKIGRDPFGTTTTTNLEKLLPRLTRGDAGGCPVLAIAATARCYPD